MAASLDAWLYLLGRRRPYQPGFGTVTWPGVTRRALLLTSRAVTVESAVALVAIIAAPSGSEAVTPIPAATPTNVALVAGRFLRFETDETSPDPRRYFVTVRDADGGGVLDHWSVVVP